MPISDETVNRIVSEIMCRFDFKKVNEHMVETKWTWTTILRKDAAPLTAGDISYRIPDMKDIQKTAERLIRDLIKSKELKSLKAKNHSLGTGGFTAMLNKVKPNSVSLIFTKSGSQRTTEKNTVAITTFDLNNLDEKEIGAFIL